MIASRRVQYALVACVAAALAVAACTSNTTATTTAPSCSFSVAQPATTTFGPEAGSGTAAVTAGSSCAWTATSSAAFLTITAGASGSGNGTVSFAVAANAGAERTATLTIAGSATTITQRAPAATPTPAPTLSAPSARSPIGGASVDPGRPTLVVNNAASTGSIGTVTYRFEVSDQEAFPADAARTFTQDGVAQGASTTSWTVARDLGANVTWYWRARATNGTVTSAFSSVETFRTIPACTYALSATTAIATAVGGGASLTVTADSGCAWTGVSNSAFITVTSGASGAGNGTVSYTVAANAGAARTGTLTIAGQTVTVSQAAAASPSCFYTLSATNITVSGGGENQSVTVTTNDSSCAWTVASNASFITVTSTASNAGTGTATFTVQANTGSSSRTGTLTVAGQTVNITQAAAVGLVASFAMFDPASQGGATTECRFRDPNGTSATTCTLRSTSFTLGNNTIVNWQWSVQYTYGTVKTLTQSGAAPNFTITDSCGGAQSTTDGASNSLTVTLTVTDNNGATAIASSGVGNQPALAVRLFTCGS